jgi:hypothetical protein
MGLGETGDWDGAVKRITNLINGDGEDPLEGALPEGYGSDRLLERFARQFEGDYGMELGMTLPTLLAGFSGATQGGFVAPMVQKLKPRELVWTPLVFQFMGIAEAGQQKSTLLKEVAEPLHKALDRVAADERRHLVDKWREAAKADFGAKGIAVDAQDGAWTQVYEGGLCTSSITDQGTPEGIRNNLIEHGGHRVILTAEPDVLREISAYSKGNSGGSIGLLLRGWGQENLAVDRAGAKALAIREPSLPYVIMVQPESFVRYTGGGDGNDDFVDRGVFSRVWLWRAERTPILDEFAEVGEEDWLGDGAGDFLDQVSAMSVLREKLESRMTAVALRTNEYRAAKGVEQAWAASRQLWMPRPVELSRERLEFEGLDGLKAHVKVQRMRAMLRQAVREADGLAPGQATVLDPMAVRFTDHVTRIAALLSLADDPGSTSVDTGHIEDVATRLMPWLWSGWWRVMRERLEENSRTFVAESLLKNAKGKDLTGGGALRAALAKLGENGVASTGGFTPSEIFKVVKSRMPKTMRSGITEHLRKELLALVAEGQVEAVPGIVDATGQPSLRYRLTVAGQQAAQGDG